jgi:hypothetical protein
MTNLAFEEYQAALRKFSERIHAVSEEINVNRAKFIQAGKRFEDAVLADQDTQEIESELAGLNAEMEILNRKADAFNKATGKGSNSFVREAAQKVIEENRKEIEALRVQWEAKKEIILDLQRQYLKALCDLGAIARESAHLREQCTLASGDAGSNVHVASLGDALDIYRRRGFVFMDEKKIALAYTSSKMPIDETFAGIVTGTPKPKIRTDSNQIPPAREYKDIRRQGKSLPGQAVAEADPS